jgi:fluoride exporter
MTDKTTEQILPLDSDIEVDESKTGTPRLPHLRLKYLGLVAMGGAFGTALREAINILAPTWGGVPIATAAINITGAFLLGYLLEALTLAGEDRGTRRALRLFTGTGVLGGFTTYSALATDTVLLLQNHPVAALGYALSTVLIGAVVSWLGIMAATRLHRTATA